MLKSIGTARSECTAKRENKATYNTGYIVPDMIDFFDDDWKEIKTQIEKNIYLQEKIVLKIGLLLVISKNFLGTIRKNNVLAICISYQKLKLNSLLSELFSYKVLKAG